ncbi:MAG: MFS transporter [Sphingobium sp.]|uniref:MFS transporter n=1 Tax=Sphingobium sp. TaxID=1912891 RepID=UPI0029AB8935|nr:MFS transporter [Sphingobium sp.]MDX3908390.1 MFS transporter [Sphingobium sp.]
MKGVEPNAHNFAPHERPFLPGSPATPDHPPARRVGYFAIGTLLGLTGGLGNGLLIANLPQIQGSLGLSSTEGAWLTAIYTMTSVCMSLLLIKFRQQFGLQRFIRISLLGFLIVTVLQLFVHSYAMELIVRGAAGIVTSGLTTLCFFYIMQAMPAAARLSGIIIGFGLAQVALPLARVISPMLLRHGEIQNLFVFELGLTLLCLGSVALLRLPPSERIEAFEPLDFLTFCLFAPGMALLCAVLALGRIVWWTTPWLGYAVAGAILLIGAALLIEHHRANPLLNTRWMRTHNVLRFIAIVAIIRVLLSEQNFGSIGLLAVVGMTNDQLVALNLIVTLAAIGGIVAGVLTLNPKDLLWPVIVSAAIIAGGAFMDADATNLTRPANLYASQALIGFAALFWMGSATMVGVLRALSRGPSHIVSFSAVFGMAQSLGGLAGTAFLGSYQTTRERLHSQEIVETLVATNPLIQQRVQQLGGAYARSLGDPLLRQAEGGALFAQQVGREANILAYNDVFFLIGVLATLVVLWLGARWLYLRAKGINPLAEELVAMQQMRERAAQ